MIHYVHNEQKKGFYMWLFLTLITFSFISGAVAYNKGRSVLGGMFVGLAAGPIGFIALLFLSNNQEILDKRELKKGKAAKCHSCGEMVKKEAIKCRFCGQKLK